MSKPARIGIAAGIAAGIAVILGLIGWFGVRWLFRPKMVGRYYYAIPKDMEAQLGPNLPAYQAWAHETMVDFTGDGEYREYHMPDRTLVGAGNWSFEKDLLLLQIKGKVGQKAPDRYFEKTANGDWFWEGYGGLHLVLRAEGKADK